MPLTFPPLSSPSPFIYVPGFQGQNQLTAVQQALSRMRRHRQNPSGQQSVWHVISDSEGNGGGASTWLNSWPELLETWLLGSLGFPQSASFYHAAYGGYSAGAPGGTLPWAVAANSNQFTNYGFQLADGFTNANFTNPGMTFTSSAVNRPNSQNLDWLWLANAAGTETLAVDGAAQGPFTPGSDGKVAIEQLGPYSSAAHVLTWTAQSADLAGLVMGVTLYPGLRAAPGLQFARFNVSGRAFSDWSGANSTTHPADQILTVLGGNMHAGSSGFPATPADVLILGLLINDMQNGGAPPTTTHIGNTQAAIAQFITAYRAQTPDCSIVVCIPPVQDPTYGQVTSGNFTAAQYFHSVWKPAMLQVLEGFQVVVVDCDAAATQQGVTAGWFAATNGHPNDGGNAKWAGLLEAAFSV